MDTKHETRYGSEFCSVCRGEQDCPAVSDVENFLCTRERGHAGAHVACGGFGAHGLRTWFDHEFSPGESSNG
jgi:hypothetical protein